MAKVIAENDIAIFSFPVVIIRWLSAPEAPDHRVTLSLDSPLRGFALDPLRMLSRDPAKDCPSSRHPTKGCLPYGTRRGVTLSLDLPLRLRLRMLV